MRFVTFYESPAVNGRSGLRFGALNAAGTAVLDLELAARAHRIDAPESLSSMAAFLASWPTSQEMARDVLREETPPSSHAAWRPLIQVGLTAPLPVPNSIRDCMTFERHVVNCLRAVVRQRFPPLLWLDRLARATVGYHVLRPPRSWYERPLYYKGNRRSVVGLDADVIWPSYARTLDFELEFGVVIGTQGRNLSVYDAPECIAGYMLFNDFSARDIQISELRGHLGPAKSKDFDTGNALGPYLVTPDELADISQLELSACVNGQEWTRARAGEMHFSFPQLISYISQDETLYPGDFIASGTLPGGCGLETDRWLRPGDVVELHGGPLGVLRNRIVRRESSDG